MSEETHVTAAVLDDREPFPRALAACSCGSRHQVEERPGQSDEQVVREAERLAERHAGHGLGIQFPGLT